MVSVRGRLPVESSSQGGVQSGARGAAKRVVVGVAACALALSGVVGGVATAAPTAKPSPKPSPTATRPAPKGDKVAYLTFDDGPSPIYTRQVLWLLDKYDAKATFFMIGKAAKANPGLVREVRAGGHAIGNHTYSHPWLNKVPAGEIRRQLRVTDQVLGRTRCMRPPGGYVNETVRNVVDREGKRMVMWHVDTSDWRRPGASVIAQTVLDRARPGSVILMHDGGGERSQTVKALAKVLRTLKAEGYTFETLPKCRRS